MALPGHACSAEHEGMPRTPWIIHCFDLRQHRTSHASSLTLCSHVFSASTAHSICLLVSRRSFCQAPLPRIGLLMSTCRSYDPVAPIIHEWTYEAMVYDLLEVDENVYR